MALADQLAQGVQFAAPQDPFAQYGKMQQLQAGQTQNALAQYQLGAAQRADQEANALRQSLPADFNPSNPAHVNALLRASPVGGAALIEKLAKVRNDVLNGQKTQSEIDKARRDQFNQMQRDISANPSDAQIDAHLEDITNSSNYSASEKQVAQSKLLGIKALPYEQRFAALASQGATAAELKPGVHAQDTGAGGQLMSTPAFGGAATPIEGSQFAKAMTPYEKAHIPILQQQANASTLQANTQANTPQYMVTDQGVVALPKNPKPGAITGSVVVGPSGEPLQKELKPIPASINTAIITNNQSLKSIDEAIRLIKENPDAVGWKGYAPNKLLNEANPEGVNARAAISNIGSLKLHERSGAAVTASEFPRLAPFIPLATDDADTVVKKLQQMKTIAQGEQQGLAETYTKDQGYRPNPILNPKGAPARAAASTAGVDTSNPLLK